MRTITFSHPPVNIDIYVGKSVRRLRFVIGNNFTSIFKKHRSGRNV